MGITGLTELVKGRLGRGKQGNWVMASGCALLSVGRCDGGGTCATLTRPKDDVRTRMRGDRIQTCRWEMDSDQVNDKVGWDRV